MTQNYHSSLDLLKSSLEGESEEAIIASTIRQFLPHHQVIQLLDIGSGNGRFIRKIERECRRIGATPILTCIEPSEHAYSRLSQVKEISYPIKTHFEEFGTTELFDAILSVHSIYYLQDVRKSIRRITELLKEGGIAIVVLWSRECDLYGLISALRSEGTPVLEAHALERLLADCAKCRVVSSQSFEGPIDFERWQALNAMEVRGVFEVLTRTGRIKQGDRLIAETVREFITRRNMRGRRVNRILTWRRA